MRENKKMSTNKLLFYISLGIYIVISVINTSMFAKHFSIGYKYIMVLCFLILFVRELTAKIQINRMRLWYIAAVIIAISLVGNSGANTILTIIVYSVAASNLDFDEIASFAFKVILVSLMTILVCCWLGIIHDYVYVMAGKPRHYLGFLYALQPAGLIFELIVLNLYLNRNKKKNFGKWFLLLLGLYIFLMTKSRLTFFLEIIMFLVDFLYKKKEKIFTNRILLILERFSFVGGTVISFYLTLTYDNAFWKQALNTFLANRLSLAKSSLLRYGVKLFGQQINWSGIGLSQNGLRSLDNVWIGYDWVDNSYIQLFQLYGFIVAITFIVLITIAVCHMIRTKQYYLSFIIMIYSVYAFIDTASLSLIYNMMWLAIFGSILSSYSERKVKPLNTFHSIDAGRAIYKK